MTHQKLKQTEFVLMYALLKMIEKYSERLFTIKRVSGEHTLFEKLQIFNEYKYSIRFDVEKCLSVPLLLCIDSSHKNELVEFWEEFVPINETFHVKDLREHIMQQHGCFRNVFHFENEYLTIRTDFSMFVEDLITREQLMRFLEIKNIDSETIQVLKMIDDSIEMLHVRGHLRLIIRNQEEYLQWFPRIAHLQKQYQQYFNGENVLESHTDIIKREMFGWIKQSLSNPIPVEELEFA